GQELLAGIRKTKPDVLLLDINLPDKQGDELSRTIRKKSPQLKIIALTNLDNIYYINSMLQSGVSGYVLKNVKRETLVAAIHEVHEGNVYLDELVQRKIQEEQ